MAAARQDPVVAAWICVLDQYNLPPNTPIAPEEFWGVFEQLYCNDIIDDDQYYNSQTAERIRAGRRSIRPDRIHDALGRLTALRMPRGSHMPTNPSDLFGDDTHALVTTSPLNGVGLAHHHNGNGSPGALFAEHESAPAMDLFQNNPPSPPDLFFDNRPPSLELEESSRARPSALTCTDPSNNPFEVQLNVQISCCGRPISIIKEDAKGLLDSTEYIPAEESGDEHDVAEFVFHGRCDICQTTVCASAIKPVLRGTMGRVR